jgi:hypothetical protein
MEYIGYWSNSVYDIVMWTLGFPFMFSTFLLTGGEMEFHDNYILAFFCWMMSIGVGMFIGYLVSSRLKG